MKRPGRIDWFVAVCVVAAAAVIAIECVDWFDRRSCRMNGGRVVEIDDDWECVRCDPASTPPRGAP